MLQTTREMASQRIAAAFAPPLCSPDYEARNGIPMNCSSFRASTLLTRLRGAKWHPDELQQLSRLFVGLRRRHHRHVHAARLVDLHIVDLREQQLVAQAQRVVAAAVEAARRHALEVAHARQRDVQQPIEELPHALAAERDHRADRHPFSDLERRDRFLRAAHHRLLPRDARELVGAGVDDLRVRGRLAEAHVHDDLVDLRHGHHVFVPELLLQGRDDVLGVLLFQPGAHLSTTPSHLRQIRTLRPSPRILRPTRVCAPHSGHTSCTFDAWSDASRSTMPPLMFLPGFGFVWRLIMFTPSTMRRSLARSSPGRTFSTRPRLPRSLPLMTSTLSFFRIGLARRLITEPRGPTK